MTSPVPVHKYTPADRPLALALLKDPRAIDSPSHRLLVHSGVNTSGVLVWLPLLGSPVGHLAALLTSHPSSFTLLCALALAGADDALEQGYRLGSFDVLNRSLLSTLTSRFDITPLVVGTDPGTGKPAHWYVVVDLHHARRQLQHYLS